MDVDSGPVHLLHKPRVCGLRYHLERVLRLELTYDVACEHLGAVALLVDVERVVQQSHLHDGRRVVGVTEVHSQPPLLHVLWYVVDLLEGLEYESLDHSLESESVDPPKRFVLLPEAFDLVHDGLLEEHVVLVGRDEVIRPRVSVYPAEPVVVGEGRVVVDDGEARRTHLELLPFDVQELVGLVAIEDVPLSSSDLLLGVRREELDPRAVAEHVGHLRLVQRPLVEELHLYQDLLEVDEHGSLEGRERLSHDAQSGSGMYQAIAYEPDQGVVGLAGTRRALLGYRRVAGRHRLVNLGEYPCRLDLCHRALFRFGCNAAVGVLRPVYLGGGGHHFYHQRLGLDLLALAGYVDAALVQLLPFLVGRHQLECRDL